MSPSKKAPSKKADTFSAEEKAAMKEAARERRKKGKGDGEADVLAKIAEMADSDRVMAQRFHKIVKATAPELEARTWYGMPAYARDGRVVCFFQSGQKFKTRYATIGFSDRANLDDGALWPVAFALKKLTKAEEPRIVELLKQAIG